MNNIPIFCINLERAKQRKENIIQKWIKELNFDITFWQAYDRRNIEKNKFIYPYNKEETQNTIHRQLNYGELACATSFCLLYEHIISLNLSEVIIMEDDIMPNIQDKQELYNTINMGKTEFPEAEIILLHEPENRNKTFSSDNLILQKEYCSMLSVPPWGNQLFYSKQNGIKKMLDILQTMCFPADRPQKLLAKENLVIMSNRGFCKHIWIGADSESYIENGLRNTLRNFIP
jgi:GR25 family glycosyltransferase involved in LPS biosynthesis